MTYAAVWFAIGLLMLSPAAVWCDEQTPLDVTYLFVLHDAGETYAMRPVMDALHAKNIPYRALVMATAATLLNNSNTIDMVKDIGGTVQILS